MRKADLVPAGEVGFRHLWGQTKRAELLQTAEAPPEVLYNDVAPVLPLGLPFTQTAVNKDWFDWPALPNLFPVSFPGVMTSRDGFLVDTDIDRLRARLDDYFDNDLSHEEIERRYPGVMKTTPRFDARKVRNALLTRGGPDEAGFVRLAYRPFDNRWLYWEAETKLLDEKRADYKSHVFEGNLWLVLQNKARPDLSPPIVISDIGDRNQMNSGVYCVPVWLSDFGIARNRLQRLPNLSGVAKILSRTIGRQRRGPVSPYPRGATRSCLQPNQRRCPAGRGSARLASRLARRQSSGCCGGARHIGNSGPRTGTATRP